MVTRQPIPARGLRYILTLAGPALLLAVLPACSTSQIDSIPASIGGLPTGTPERAANPPAYPPVHDMPPPRAAPMLDEDQQQRLEKDLVATRNRQSKQKKTIERDTGGTRNP